MAFSVLLSLAQTIEQILNDDRYLISVDGKHQIVSIQKQAISLQEFLEKFPKEAKSLERRIWNAANEAEDTIEHFMYEQIRSRYKLIRATAAKIASVNSKHQLYDFHALKRVVEEIDSIAREVMEMIKSKDGRRLGDSPTAPSSSSTVFSPFGDSPAVPSSFSTVSSPTGDDIVVGFHELTNIKVLLCGESSQLQVITIVGMGGIGKTTLTRMSYNDGVTVERFDIRAWVTISQDYESQNILWELLHSMKELNAERHGQSNELMRLQVYQFLKARRYLIVLDDLWSKEAWDDLKMIFPDDNNGSRIMLTTRLLDVASHASSSSLPYRMRFLNPDESWVLLEKNVFKQQSCPPKLVKIGREITRSCGGLPLAIVLIAGVLSNKTPASWKEIAEDIHSVFHLEEAEQFEKIISLSYTNLPHHLRPCFLYMAAFPEDYEIHVSKLIKLWIAEGFVKPSASKSFEEVAGEYLEDLVKRSLALVKRRKSNGRIKSCSVHDLVRDLCKRKSQEENFKRRLSIGHSDLKRIAETYGSTIRSVICFQPSESSLGSLRKFRLLRVLDVVDATVYSLPAQVFELFHLRYLAFGCPMEIPAAISMLQNLHTLIICPRKGSRRYTMDEVYLPLEIWTMPLLRHLVSFFDLLPDPEGAAFALENLQTLSVVKKFICSKRMLERIPNLKKLGITFFGDKYPEAYQLNNLVHLRQLEKLKLTINGDPLVQLNVGPVFPESLGKLTLSGWQFSWEYMKTVGSLPNLQVLKLRDFACKGNEWETTEGEFPCLRYLLIDRSDLEHWITESSHFPRLECLVLYRCFSLVKIPSEIGEIPTLQLIEVDHANKSVFESAKGIQEEQEELGNYGLQVRRVRYHYQHRTPAPPNMKRRDSKQPWLPASSVPKHQVQSREDFKAPGGK